MKKIIAFLFFVLFFPSVVFAGEIYGTIKKGKSAVDANVFVAYAKVYVVEVDAKIADINEATSDANSTKRLGFATTDKYGSYSLYIEKPGKCKLLLYYPNEEKKEWCEIEIYSYNESIRYDLILEKKNGKYLLRRE